MKLKPTSSPLKQGDHSSQPIKQSAGTDKGDEGYEVGYGKPPVEKQFKQGQSGNPKGRAKGSKNGRTIYNNECDIRLEVTENGKKRKVTKRELVYKATVNNAIKGDTRAAAAFYKLEDKHAPLTDGMSGSSNLAPNTTNQQQSEMDRLILQCFNIVPATAPPDPVGSSDDKHKNNIPEPTKRSTS
jgi:hypothetical protein